MDSNYLEYSTELGVILLDYFNYLKENDVYSDKSFDYVFDIVDFLNIEKKYFAEMVFDEQLKSEGVFLPQEKKIKLNLKNILMLKKLKYLSVEEYILEYYTLLLHELNHLFHYRNKRESCDDVATLLRNCDIIRLKAGQKYRDFSKFFPDEIDSYLKSSKLVDKFVEYNMIKDNNSSKNRLVYYLTFNIFNGNEIINSQYDYLKYILFNEHCTNYHFSDEIQNVYYGLAKKDETINSLLDTYRSQELKIKI